MMTKEEQLEKKKAGEGFILTSTDNVEIVQKSISEEKKEVKEETSEAKIEPDVKIETTQEDIPTIEAATTEEPIVQPDSTSLVTDSVTSDNNIDSNASMVGDAFATDITSINTDNPLTGLNTEGTSPITSTEDVSKDAANYAVSFGVDNPELTTDSSVQSEELPSDLKYFKDPNAIDKIKEIIVENISIAVRNKIEEELDKIFVPLKNTAMVGERSYNDYYKIIKNGLNLDNYKEFEAITRLKEEGIDAANEMMPAEVTNHYEESSNVSAYAPSIVDTNAQQPVTMNQDLFGEEPSKIIPIQKNDTYVTEDADQFTSPFNPFNDEMDEENKKVA